jgi:hypothetical protein
MEPKSVSQVFVPAIFKLIREISMRLKLAIPVFAVAALFVATAPASAQTPMAAGASSENAMASMRHHHHWHHSMHYSRRQMDKSRVGGRPVSRKPAD